MKKIDYYQNKLNNKPNKQFEIMDVLYQIQDGAYRSEAERVRNAQTLEEKDTAKFEASGFTFSGTFEVRRSDSLIQHSGLVAIDIDGLNENVEVEKERLRHNPYTFSVFLSISGTGLRVLVKVPDNLNAYTHKLYYNAIAEDLQVKADPQAKDVSRYTNVTYDPRIYYNLDSLVWDKEVEIMKQSEPIQRKVRNDRKIENYTGDTILDTEEKIQIILSWTKDSFVKGNRNRCVYETACNLCEYGISKEYTFDVLAEYAEEGFTTAEIKIAVDSAYRKAVASSKELHKEEPLSEMKELFSKVKTNLVSQTEQKTEYYHLEDFKSYYRPDMKIVVVDSDEVAEKMAQIIPSFKWISTNGQQLSALLLKDIPKKQGILICPRLQKSPQIYQWNEEILNLPVGEYKLSVWEWWNDIAPLPEDYENESTIYDVICR